MKKLLCALAVLASLSTASADIRIFNGTSEDFVIDVLSQAGQERDILVPARSFSKVVGAKNVPGNTTEMVVYKDKSGNEISRAEYYSGAASIFRYHSDTSFRRDELYSFNKDDNRQDMVIFVNNTRDKIATKWETPDFKIKESSVRGPDKYTNGVFLKNVVSFDHQQIGGNGATLEFTLTSPVFQGPQKAKFTGGHVYQLDSENGQLKVTQLYP
ncbi:MAG: hypothetical protein KC800_27635 [Candidatus Eremiobacteraeota bacterium]|nr:hypothetical protein [Candidatus Eremiobacteraeota bacterium]